MFYDKLSSHIFKGNFIFFRKKVSIETKGLVEQKIRSSLAVSYFLLLLPVSFCSSLCDFQWLAFIIYL